MKHLSIRIPDEFIEQADDPALQAFLKRQRLMPTSSNEVCRSDVLRAALSIGLDRLRRWEKLEGRGDGGHEKP